MSPQAFHCVATGPLLTSSPFRGLCRSYAAIHATRSVHASLEVAAGQLEALLSAPADQENVAPVVEASHAAELATKASLPLPAKLPCPTQLTQRRSSAATQPPVPPEPMHFFGSFPAGPTLVLDCVDASGKGARDALANGAAPSGAAKTTKSLGRVPLATWKTM